MALIAQEQVVVGYLKKEGAPYRVGIHGHGCLPLVSAQAYEVTKMVARDFPRSAGRKHGNWDPTSVPAYLRK